MQTNRLATPAAGGITTAHTLAITRFAEHLRPGRWGGAVVLEGLRLHRQQLSQALVQHLGHRVTLGAVVSKYIGQTEKNLDQLFARANNGGSILFLDEADALFGSRTDVKDSHDRYANLFNRLGTFQGQVVLGVDNKNTVPCHMLPRCRILSVHDYWPPR
jgi:hypothetical protein